MGWRRRGAFGADVVRRRSGPEGEERWWDPLDQQVAEAPVLARADLARGWRPAPMMNNVERLDPLGDDPASELVRAARAQRHLTGLDEGRAWRRSPDGGLLVVRVEVFAPEPLDADGATGGDRAVGRVTAHRSAWQAHGAAALDATWRQRWRERDVEPRWIEARALEVDERPEPLHGFREAPTGSALTGAVDWLRIEDHTDPTGGGRVTLYEHLSLWLGRGLVTLTLRHDLDHDAADVAATAAAAVARRWQPKPAR